MMMFGAPWMRWRRNTGFQLRALRKRPGLTRQPSILRSIGVDGRARWPSTESIAKVLDAVGARMEDFAALVTGAAAISRGGRTVVNRRIPLIGLAQAGGEGYFDDGGYPVGGSWDEISLPEIGDANAYALEISGDSMEPVFRDGDVVIVSPAAPVRRGDRVVVRTRKGEVMAKELRRHSAKRIDVASLNPAHPSYSFELPEIAWVHRIVWASQ